MISARNMRLTLAAMTLSSSMILVDQTAVPLATPDAIAGLGASVSQSQWLMTANIIPLAALMVFGGRLGDLLGMRRVFLWGAVLFAVATAAMGGAQDLPWAIAARALQGVGAAMMMPTGLAIVSRVYPEDQKGSALGILAGASAFFAALGPMLGGALTAVDWRLVFLINVPLALITIGLTLKATPSLPPDPDASRDIDLPGVLIFAAMVGTLVYGLSNGPQGGWTKPATLATLVIGVLLAPVFVIREQRAANPMIDFSLLRSANFLAANISQVLAGAVELGLGFLTPFFLLLVVGISPAAAGVALIPATLLIIVAGPAAGKAFDRFGGRWPLVVGFLILALSSVVLSLSVSDRTAVALIPGLLLQGLGLGTILTVNDPTGLTAVPEDSSGEAAGMINTAEQLGGAFGIAVLTAIELGLAVSGVYSRLASQGIHPTHGQNSSFEQLLLNAEQSGIKQVNFRTRGFRLAAHDVIASHVTAFQVMFLVSAGIALVGALVCAVLVRHTDRQRAGRIFSRRSRWVYVGEGRSPAITRVPEAVAERAVPAADHGTP